MVFFCRDRQGEVRCLKLPGGRKNERSTLGLERDYLIERICYFLEVRNRDRSSSFFEGARFSFSAAGSKVAKIGLHGLEGSAMLEVRVEAVFDIPSRDACGIVPAPS